MPTATTATLPKLEWDGVIELGAVAQLISTQESGARGTPNIRPLADNDNGDQSHNCHYRANYHRDGKMVYSAYVRIRWAYTKVKDKDKHSWEPAVIDIDGKVLKPMPNNKIL